MKNLFLREAGPQGCPDSSSHRQGCLIGAVVPLAAGAGCRMALCAWLLLTAGVCQAEDRDWRQKAPIENTETPTGVTEKEVKVRELARVKEVSGLVNVRRNEAGGREMVRRVQPGDAAYVGDQFEVGMNSSLELIFGMNSRLKIGADSILRMVQKSVEKKSEAVTVSQSDLELKKGSARVRVRKNTRTPSPMLIVAGTARLTLNQTDAALFREEAASSRVVVLSGKADVVYSQTDPQGKLTENVVEVKERRALEVPDKADGKASVPEILEEEELRRIAAQLVFSIDREREALPPAPPRNRELDGP